MAGRPGFSLLELLVVLTLTSIGASLALPAFGRSLARLRVERAANGIVSTIQLAHSTAARQRTPVRLSIDTAASIIRVRHYTNPATVYAEQRLDSGMENGVQELTASDTSVVIYPSGLVEKQIEIELRAADYSRRVRLTRGGQTRVLQ
jgi:prepilin-type N-terminal cleavage/methylation domain-containing protein